MLETDSYDDVRDALERADNVTIEGSVDGVRGIIIAVRADTKEHVVLTVAQVTSRSNAEQAVYTTDNDPEDVYRVGLPMEGI